MLEFSSLIIFVAVFYYSLPLDMILNIQIGDFYGENDSTWLDYLGTFVGVFLGAAIPLLLYYLETRRETRRSEDTKRENRENSLKYFSTLLESIISVAERQVVEYKEHSQNLKEHPINYHLLRSIIAEDLNRVLNKLEHERIFHAYLDRFDNSLQRIQTFQQMFSRLDYIDKLYKQAYESQEKQITDLTLRLNKYKALAEEQVLDYCAYLLHALKKQELSDDFDKEYYTTLEAVMVNYYTNASDPITFDYMQEQFINILKLKVVKNFKDSEGAMHIMEYCKKASLLYYEITQKSFQVSDEFSQYHSGLSGVVGELKELSKDLIPDQLK